MSDPTIEQSSNEPTIEEMSSTCEMPSKKQKRLTSKVWLDFDKVKKLEKQMVDGKKMEVMIDKAICKHCKHEFDGSSTKGTTHLNNHLTRCPSKKKTDIRQQLIQATAKKDDGSCVLSNFQFDDSRSQRLLAEAIIIHEYPFNIVTHEAFQEYVHSLRPSHKIPCRTSITKLCTTTVYEDERKKLYDMFSCASYKLSFTMDKWTASSQNKSYLCITAHYIDEVWMLQKRIIGFINVLGATGSDICNVFMSRLLDWNVDRKVVTVTVDNDKANDVALRLAKDRLRNSLPCDGVFFHVRCVAHIINLIVQDGLKKITQAIEKVRLSVKYITCSPQMEESFYKIAKQIDLKSKKCLSLDCCTRWNSTYLMLVNALEYKHAFNRFQLKDDKYTHCPSNREWKHVEILSKCLKHFYDVTELLSGTKYPTANLFFEQFCEIQLLLIEWLKSMDDVIVSMAFAIKKKFDKYWKMCNHILAVATFLDPRFKMVAIGFYFNELYGADGLMRTNEITNIIKNLYSDYAANTIREGQIQIIADVSSSISHDKCDDKRKSRFAQFIETTESEPSKTDLDLYMVESVLQWDEQVMGKFDILAWWKLNVGKFPTLARMARDVLAIPVSTVASESAFSTGGRVVDSARNMMAIDTVEALICAQDWLKARRGVQKAQSFIEDIFTMDNSSISMPFALTKASIGDGMDLNALDFDMEDDF